MGMPNDVPVPSNVDRTKQAFKDECDINNILKRYKTTGMLSHLARGEPVFLDVSEMPDFRSALEHVKGTQKFFEGLSAEVRSHFKNDAAVFMDQFPLMTADELKAIGIVRQPKKTEAAPGSEPPPPAQ